MSIYLHGERSGGVAEPILYDPRVNTGKYQGRGVSVSEMVQLDGRCFGPFGYPRKGMGDGIGIGGIPELVGKYQILIPVCASETQNVLGLSSSVVAQQCDGVRVESDPATPCGCFLGESNTMPRPVSLWAVSTTDTIDRSRSTFLHRSPRASDRRNPVNAMNRNIGPHRVGSAEVKILATTLPPGRVDLIPGHGWAVYGRAVLVLLSKCPHGRQSNVSPQARNTGVRGCDQPPCKQLGAAPGDP